MSPGIVAKIDGYAAGIAFRVSELRYDREQVDLALMRGVDPSDE